jgi:hypothetical protein
MSNVTTTSVNLTKKDPNPINLTDGAAEKVAELIAAEGVDEVLALRVSVKPGGCSGFNYDMYFDSEFADDDIVREFAGVKVVVDWCERGTPERVDARVLRLAAGRRIPHHESQRDAHLRLRQLLQLETSWQ